MHPRKPKTKSFERGLAICHSADVPVQVPLIASCLGAAYAFVERLDEGNQLLESAVADTASMKRMAGQAMRVAWLSRAYLLAGRAGEAETLAARGLQLTAASKDKGSQAWLLETIADAKLQRMPLDAQKAETDYRTALALAKELGMRPLQAHCHLGMGRLYTEVNNLASACSEFYAAIDTYKSTAMSYWLLQAEAALATISSGARPKSSAV